MAVSALLEPIIKSAAFPDMLSELQTIWEAEQLRRAEFYNWVTPDIKAEFIEGEIVVHSPVRLRHNSISKRLTALLDFYVIKNNLGFVGIEKIMVRLTRNDYEPDICFFGKAKSEKFTEEQTLFPAPDFVVEVTSPSTEGRDRGVKYEDYARHGVQEYWIVVPNTQTVEQYQLKGDTYELVVQHTKGEITCLAIEGLTLPTRALFDDEMYAQAITALAK